MKRIIFKPSRDIKHEFVFPKYELVTYDVAENQLIFYNEQLALSFCDIIGNIRSGVSVLNEKTFAVDLSSFYDVSIRVKRSAVHLICFDKMVYFDPVIIKRLSFFEKIKIAFNLFFNTKQYEQNR